MLAKLKDFPRQLGIVVYRTLECAIHARWKDVAKL